MRFGTSFFNGAVYKKTFFRYWPIWGIKLVVWLLALPLPMLFSMQYNKEELLDFSHNLINYGNSFLILAGAIVLAAMAAMAVCSHLYRGRSAHFFGTLPVRREGLFLSAYLAGLTMLIAPNLVIVGLTALVELAGGRIVWQPLLFLLAVICIEEFFFYSMAVLCGMFTGHILALPVFFVVANLFVIVGDTLVQSILSEFYYGYLTNSTDVWASLVRWLTPAGGFVGIRCVPGLANTFTYKNATALIVYGVAAPVLVVAALLLYRRRRLELAGDVVAVRCMRPVFHWGAGLSFGILNGFITRFILGLDATGLIVSMAIWTVVCSFLAQMLLDKRFRVFAKWKSCLAPVAVLLAVCTVIGFDLTGYETRVPEPNQVESIVVTGLDGFPDDSGYTLREVKITEKEQIESVITLHRLAIEERDADFKDIHRIVYGSEFANIVHLELVYHLTDGGTMSRNYYIYPPQMDTEGTAAHCIQQLRDDPAIIRQCYGFDSLQASLDQGGILIVGCFNRVGGYDGDISYYADEDAHALWVAVQQDLVDGTIGRHSIFDAQKNLRLILVFDVDPRNPETETMPHEYMHIDVPETAVHTLAVLKQLKGK